MILNNLEKERNVVVMLTRREKLLVLPWQERRWTQHRVRVKTAVSAVDTQPPAIRSHVTVKLKKLQVIILNIEEEHHIFRDL